MSAPKLALDPDRDHAGGGTVTYRVTLNGRWIGWVGDTRPWRGHRFGGRRWWACWREDGDTAARWNSGFGDDDGHRTRADAVAALLKRVVSS